MKTFRVIIYTLAIWMCIAANAQDGSSSYTIGGAVFDRDIISTTDLLELSQRQTFSTARSHAMGGAFTSLGADLAAVAYNPAGLGMYQHNDASFSMAFNIDRATTTGAMDMSNGKNTNTRFGFNNIGIALNLYKANSRIKSVTFAISYNKLADYNYNRSFVSYDNVGSLADAFSDLAQGGKLYINNENRITDRNGYVDFNMNPYYWGDVLAYKCGLINNPTSNQWYPDEIGNGALMNHFYNIRSRGSAGEISFAVGANLNNVLYFGASIDIATIRRTQNIYYGENINYSEQPSFDELPSQLRTFGYEQSTKISGIGVGAKFGITLRPVSMLRIGLAIHTPTYYSVSYQYEAMMTSEARTANGIISAQEISRLLIDEREYRWKFSSPTRVLTGISYTFPYAILSADYEYDRYSAMSYSGAPFNVSSYNNDIANNFQNAHIVRVGLEIPMKKSYLRAGGGIISRMVKKDTILSNAAVEQAWNVSCGVGFKLLDNLRLDVSYAYRRDSLTDYLLYYSINDQTGARNESGIFNSKLLRHNLAISLCYKW
ncbi:MAG: hypothetical protein KBS95_01325 [Alistipes sp.]|nr:hypothetical protein [Candidatus Alistipes equi]